MCAGRLRVSSLALTAVLLTAGACSRASKLPERRVPALGAGTAPDIVLVSIDSLRPDHLHCYGYPKPTSPAIDRLAAEGALFRNAVSTTSWTLPAHAAMLTGLSDGTHGLVNPGLRLSDDVVTLAQALKAAGYRTAGFFGGPYLHPAFGIAQGFDSYEDCMTKYPGDLSQPSARSIARAERSPSHSDITGPRTVEKVATWLDGLDARPFFLFVHLWDVHYDYIPPAEYVRLFDPGYSGTLTGDNVMRNPAVNPDMPKREFDHLLALYDGEIRFTDDNLERILKEIDRHGRLDSALVVVSADHGEEFFEHGGKGHAQSLYDEVLRIPLVIRWRGRIEPGRVVEDQVRIIDIMPTVLSLAGVPLQSEVEGRDLSPLLWGDRLEAAPALCELHANERTKLYAVRTNRWKIVTFPTHHWWQFGAEYFDLERDPGERASLSPWSVGFFEARWTLGRLWRDEAALRERLGTHAALSERADPEVLQRLISLGYISAGEGPSAR